MLYRPTSPYRLWRLRSARISAALSQLSGQLREGWRLGEAVRRLSRLDDRLLADLGVRRDEIAARVRGRR